LPCFLWGFAQHNESTSLSLTFSIQTSLKWNVAMFFLWVRQLLAAQ